ncbi:MAG TPA: TIGR02587 family membrane protein, partial [Verrucomicrobiae bacterium]|nr:TIGR02587 family membrane protein [Verrucomicrobiae bacterium]
LGRAIVGAALFALPLFMTMEMWDLGASVDPARIAAMLVVFLPALVALSYYAGFERAFGLIDHLLDAFAAIAVAALIAMATLALLGVFGADEPIDTFIAKVALVTPPAAIGALLADKQLGRGERSADAVASSYPARLFLMAMGALFVAFNVAPTEEMVLIAYQISAGQALLLAFVSLAALHALLFWADLPGRVRRRVDQRFAATLLPYSLGGYGVCAVLCAYLLWTFGRLDGASLREMIEYVIVLAFPAALGAGIAQALIGDRSERHA